MKAMGFRLFVTMITLAAVTYITALPANAQRRTTGKEKPERETKSRNDLGKSVEKKSTFKNYDKVDRNRVNRDLKARRNTTGTIRSEQSNAGNNKNSKETSVSAEKPRQTKNARSYSSEQKKNKREISKENSPANTSRQGDLSNRNRNSTKRVDTYTDEGRRNTGRTVSDRRDFYRTDENDKRYSPNSDYRGSRNSWSERERPREMNYNHNNREYYSHYNFNTHKHWDGNWERYHWTFNSWRDYYHGYNPTSFVYYKYYYHHPRYGHVIRRFDFRPVVFIHNHNKYYAFEGHFFRYRSGIGYILVDLPFGFTFDVLPSAYYERAYINGYLYFRVGNLFFESNGNGFSLVHYPERYYAWDNSYTPQGYYFDDIYY